MYDVVVSAGSSYDARRVLDNHCIEHKKPSVVLAASGAKGAPHCPWVEPRYFSGLIFCDGAFLLIIKVQKNSFRVSVRFSLNHRSKSF